MASGTLAKPGKLHLQQPDVIKVVRAAPLAALPVESEATKTAAAEATKSAADQGRVPRAADEGGALSPTALALSLACIGCGRLPSDMGDERETHPESPKCIKERVLTTCGIDCPANPLARKPHAAYHKEVKTQRKTTDDGGESQLAPGEIAERLARQAVQSGKSYHELLAQSTQHASKQDWRRAARACREAIALAPDKPVAYAALGAMYLSSRLYVEAAQWFLEAKERYPEGSEGWVAATANAFDLLRQTVCDEAAKPDWWNDEGLKALSAKVVRAAPADAAANRMRAYVLSGRCAAWVAGPRSSAEFNEAGTHFERAAASVRLESLLQRCRPSSPRTRYRPRYLKACSPAHPEASSTPSQTSATESDRWSTSDSFRSDYE